MKNTTKIITLVLILALSLSAGCTTKELFEPTGTVDTDKSSYEPGETIIISWSNLNFIDRIDITNSEGVLMKGYSPEPTAGSFMYILTDSDEPGTWKATLYYGHNIIDQKEFTIEQLRGVEE